MKKGILLLALIFTQAVKINANNKIPFFIKPPKHKKGVKV